MIPVAFDYAPKWWRRASAEKRGAAVLEAIRQFPGVEAHAAEDRMWVVGVLPAGTPTVRLFELRAILSAAVDYRLCQYRDRDVLEGCSHGLVR